MRQNARIARVLRVLELIQSRGRWNANAMAQELEYSERTIYRDLQVLELAGIPWFFDEHEQCYRVRPDCRFPVLNLTDDELVGQAIATVATKAKGLDIGSGASPTTRKLAAKSVESAQTILADAERLIAIFDLKLADHSRHQEIFKSVQWAVLKRKQLTGQYESPYELKPVTLKLHPYRLCLVKNAWYVIGRPVDEKEPRTYRVARFKTLRMLDQPAAVPDDFDLCQFFGNAWAVYRGEKRYDIEIWFTPEAAKIVTETQWHDTQKVVKQKDGSVILQFRIDGLEEILNWILSWTGRIKVLQPATLRDLVVEKLKLALEMNQE
jgi:predicted DNA-binding transcriptional regulator YafY